MSKGSGRARMPSRSAMAFATRLGTQATKSLDATIRSIPDEWASCKRHLADAAFPGGHGIEFGLEARMASGRRRIDHMIGGEELLDRDLGADLGMLPSHENRVGLAKEKLLYEIGMQAGEHSDGQIDLAELHHLLRGVERHVQRHDLNAGRGLAQPRGQQRYEYRLADGAHVQPERAYRGCRIESLPGPDRQPQRGKSLVEEDGDPVGSRRGLHAVRRLHEEHIVEQIAQPPERIADGRLRQVERLGRARRVPRPVKDVEDQQQVQIDVAKIDVGFHLGDY